METALRIMGITMIGMFMLACLFLLVYSIITAFKEDPVLRIVKKNNRGK